MFIYCCYAGAVITNSPLTAATHVLYLVSVSERVIWSPSWFPGLLQFPPTQMLVSMQQGMMCISCKKNKGLGLKCSKIHKTDTIWLYTRVDQFEHTLP